MPTALDRKKVRRHLENFDLQALFIEELGFDYGGVDMEVPVSDSSFSLKAIAHKRGMVVYQHVAASNAAFPDYSTRQKVEKFIAKTVREHVIVYATHDKDIQYWQWVKREQGQPDRNRLHIYHRDQPGESLIQKLERLVFTLEEEEDLTIVDVSGRVRAAFDMEKVTRRFYDRFKKEHDTFLALIDGIQVLANREWYASLMLNRMMFIYFIQKRNFLDDDPDYLRNRLKRMKKDHGKDRFQTFYRLFLLRLFHEGLNQPVDNRASGLTNLLGRVPYLNGGLFELHDLERNNENIHIPDEAFQRIFDFFDAYQWHLDDNPLHDDNEINPDVLGYIFEKYINQKQMGAYYTKEDITGYISRNTVIPFLFDQAKKECPIAFSPDGGIWRLLSDDPDRYFYESIRHGITYDINEKRDISEKRELPADIAAGLHDISKRGGWDNAAPAKYALPTETWREHIARRQRYEEVRAKLVTGEIVSINDLVTYNLDIEKFTQDVIAWSEGPELIRAFWKAITNVSVLDPTCGSGAFLFATLNILEPIYMTCLEVMEEFLDDLKRSGRNHHPGTMGDFHKLLDRVGVHANERYFILKSIIINNLYGVDVMEEAVEICKLRLFLKLVAQLETYDQIEPLPDIDFNIRVGNTLVGFASLEEVKRRLSADMVKQMALPKIEKQAEIVDRAFRKFREMQTDQDIDARAFANAKSDLRERLDDLRVKLNYYLGNEYGIKNSDEETYEKWCDTHQPFHWFVEFHSIMHGGGFDVVIGNPPYVSVKEIPYSILGPTEKGFPDIYGHIVSKSLALTIPDGRCGMIIPLSITFSRDFKALRKNLCDWGVSWFSSYDNIPAALFAGVSQRCTIWVGRNSGAGIFVAPLYRWRTSYRSCLLTNLAYVPIKSLDFGELGLPKVTGLPEIAVLRAISSTKTKKYRTAMSGGRGYKAHLGFSQAARNFISVFLEDPPCLDATSLDIVAPSKIGRIAFADDADTCAALAATAGELYFWYWLVRGDGFDVTSWVVRDFLEILDFLPPEHYEFLIELGRMLHSERNRWLVFKKNAGRYVGNFNYGGAFRITRRADLLILDALSRNREEALAIFDYVQRVLAINEYAGEKGIPASVKAKFAVNQMETDENEHLFSKIDSKLSEKFFFTERDMAFVTNHDVNLSVDDE